MNSNGDVEKSEKTKITIRLRRKDNNDSETNNISIPAGKTSFNFHKQGSLDPKSKYSTIDARNSSPLGHFNKRWMNQSHSLPTSPNHKSHLRISPVEYSTSWKEFRKSPVWKKESLPDSLLSESDSSSIASIDSAFEEGGSGNSAKPWRPGINYRPARPLYSMPRLENQLCNRSSSADSQSSGESTTPTPGSPKLEWKNFLETQQNSAHKSKHTRRATEPAPASQVELNISRKKFSDQDRQILEGFFSTSSKASGPKGHTNFINSAVFKENRASSVNDSLTIGQSMKPPKIKPMTPKRERTIEDRNYKQRVRVFPENSPFEIMSSSNPRVSSLVKHFDKPSPDVSPESDRAFSQRPASAGKAKAYSNQSQTLPRSFLKKISQEEIPVSSTSGDLSASTELVKSKPYETNLFHCPTRRQEFLNTYLERIQKNKSSSSLLDSSVLLSPIGTPELKRACFYKQTSEMPNLCQMRPMSASVLLTKQDTFTNDPYKRKSFLDKYLNRQGHSNLISKKNTA